MILKDLSISLREYGPAKGTYQGKLVFTSQTGEIKINVDHEKCYEIFKICAGAIVDQAKRAANILTAEIVDQYNKQIEEKKL